ncbi:MAG: CBS domain-containing protein [Bdellovibrio sp.]
MPTIQKHMTTMPHTIGADATLDKAEKFMREYRIRRLPVLHGGELVGVLSDRDVKMVETFKDVDPTKVKVEEAMSADPYITLPGAALDEVSLMMAEKKWGCALVVDNKKLVGIFTWVDALKAIGEILKTRFH